MIELLRAAAAGGGEEVAIVTEHERMSYAQLVNRAELLAGGLIERGLARVALVESDAVDVVSVLAGAALAGVEVCQYQPDTSAEALKTLRMRLDHEVLVGSHVEADVAVRDLLCAEPFGGPQPGASPLLVLTTGTTGEPRAARHDWRRLLRGVCRVQPATIEQRWLLAYGLHQFAGLQVLLHVLAAQATLVAPFPRQPRDGARALRDCGVTHVSATPTYWRFLLAELRSHPNQIPALTQVTLGGEAAPADLLSELRSAFPTSRISHVYAGTEFGSTSSTRDGRPGLPLHVLEDTSGDIALKIVDDELWIRSRVGMTGYFGQGDAEDPDEWRPSGDLVEIVGDRIVFRGRRSEIINVGGVKVHPLPVEDRVNQVAGVVLARVYARPNSLVGNVVAVDIVADATRSRDAVEDEVRKACSDLIAAARPRSIRFVDELTTRGGKLLRGEGV